MESLMNRYKAKFFCGNDDNKIDDMQYLILGDDRMSFKSKHDILVFISKTHDTNWQKVISAWARN